MRAAVYRGTDFAGDPVVVSDAATLDAVAAARQARLDPRAPFSVDWQGTLVITEPGRYRVRVFADDGAVLSVDDAVLLEHTAPGRQEMVQSVDLAEGLHPIRLRYLQFTGDAELRLGWAPPSSREDFSELVVLPPQTEPLIFRRVEKALRYPTIVAVAWSVWILFGLTLAFGILVGRGPGNGHWSVLRDRWMAVLLFFAVGLLAFGVHIGAAPWRAWAPDELQPPHLLEAAQRRFANGWFNLYPPAHFYVLNLVTLPFVFLDGWGSLRLDASATQAVIHVVSRAVSVLMAVLTVVAAALIAEATIGRRRTAAAAAFVVSVPMFVFYAKTANVDMPYVFWVVIALLFFVRAMQTRSVRDHALLGAAVACAVATKDQAYGFWPGTALVLLWCAWRDTPVEWPLRRRAIAIACDRRLWAGLGVFAVLYMLLSGVIWNLQGARDHFELIVGGSQPFRMFPRTVGGLLALATATLTVATAALGPVLVALAVVGLAIALVNREQYRVLLLLLVPIASYFITFIVIVGYVYDRFLLAPAVVAALFAAVGFDAGLARIRNSHLRAMAASLVIAFALLPSIMLDWRIMNDSRRLAERWLAKLSPDPLVLGVGRREFLPNLHPFRHDVMLEVSPQGLLEQHADLIVISESWLARVGANPIVLERVIENAGYARVFMAGGDADRPWLMRIADVGRRMDPIYSNLEKIGPPLSIWQRRVQ